VAEEVPEVETDQTLLTEAEEEVEIDQTSLTEAEEEVVMMVEEEEVGVITTTLTDHQEVDTEMTEEEEEVKNKAPIKSEPRSVEVTQTNNQRDNPMSELIEDTNIFNLS